MKTILFIGLSAIAAISIIAAPQLSSKTNRPTAPAQADLDDLKAKIERLERKTADLQNQLNELREQQRALSVVSQNNGVAPVLVNPPPKPEIPQGWTPREFNGLTYYLVPLAKDTQP